MRSTSTEWAEIAAGGDFQMETKARINDVEYTAISAPKISRSLMPSPLSVGNCISATLSMSILTEDSIAAENPIIVLARIHNGQDYSEWREFGTFFINQRDASFEGLITLDCYDSMLKANQNYLSSEDSSDDWPKPMLSVAEDIAARIGVGIDPRTKINTGDDYVVAYPTGKTMLQVLGYIAACHGGNWIITEENLLRLVPLDGVQTDTENGTVNVPVVCGDLTTGTATKITGVSASDSSGNSYAVGDNSGFVLTVENNPYMTQNICNNLYIAYVGFTYAPYTATKTCFDPAAELGDQVKIGDRVSSILYSANVTLDLSFRADISAPNSEELSAEYPYLTGVKRLQTELQINYTTKEELASQMEQTSEQLLKSVSAEYVTTEYLKAYYIDAYSIETNYVTTTNLNTVVANIEDAYITKANVNTLLADYATITQLNAVTADINDLKAVTADISTLNADTANIKSLLAGNAGVGDLQAINLSSANVVIADATITDAMIASLTADKLTAGTIYTDLVTIQSNTDDTSLWISGSVIQMSDESTVRVQIGRDGNGSYNFYIWDKDGNLMWNALGVTADGLNDSIIVDKNVADDANINQSKLDMQSVAQRLNEDGSITVDSSRVQIDDTTLDLAYKSLTKQVTETAGEAVTGMVTEYYLSTSSTTQTGGEWSTTSPTWTEGTYLWTRSLVTYGDGSSSYTPAVCVTGNTGADGADAVLLCIASSNGTVFKNDNVSTVLTVTIYLGAERITDLAAIQSAVGGTAALQWSFQRLGEDVYYTVDPSDPRIGNDGFTFTLTPDDIDAKATFVCELIV